MVRVQIEYYSYYPVMVSGIVVDVKIGNVQDIFPFGTRLLNMKPLRVQLRRNAI